jgi:hypothetical protein
MLGTDSGCDISDFQVGRDPLEIRIRRKQALELIDLHLSRAPVSRDQQLSHRDRGREPSLIRLPEPGEDGIRETDILHVGFQLVNEDASVQRDPAMTSQKRLQTR